MSRLRIGLLRIAQESNCFSPVPTTLEDFQRCHFLEGDALGAVLGPRQAEVAGFMRNAELSGFAKALARDEDAEAVPLLSAWSVPGGSVTREAMASLLTRMTERLRASGPLDGVLVSLHGAMGAEGSSDPDSDVLGALRDVVGAIPVGVTHDLHANLTEARVRRADVLFGYRTNPHRDQAEIGFRAGRAVLEMLRSGLAPTVAWRSLPMISGGGTTVDFLPPMRSIFSALRADERDPKVLGASVFLCHPWNSHPDLGYSTHVMTRGDAALASELADELGDRLWAVRHAAPPTFSGIAEAISEARESRVHRKLGAVVIADASDVVAAGAPGDGAAILNALERDARDLLSYVALRDPRFVAEHFEKPEGSFISDTVGGALDPSRSESATISGKLVKCEVHPSLGRRILVDLGAIRLIVTEGHALTIKPSFFSDMGLSPWKADLIVVKNFFLFRLFFAPVARKVIYVRTRGVTDLDLAHQIETHDPIWPRDPVHSWRETDQRRRARQSKPV